MSGQVKSQNEEDHPSSVSYILEMFYMSYKYIWNLKIVLNYFNVTRVHGVNFMTKHYCHILFLGKV